MAKQVLPPSQEAAHPDPGTRAAAWERVAPDAREIPRRRTEPKKTPEGPLRNFGLVPLTQSGQSLVRRFQVSTSMNATFLRLPTMELHAMELRQGYVCLTTVACWSITKSVKTNRRADAASHREVE